MAPESALAMAEQARQHYQETSDEREFRQKNGFVDFEHDMPRLGSRFQFSLKDNLTSYLGRNNPFYSVADPKTDYVWLFDNTAYLDPQGQWQAEFVAAYFVKNSGRDLSEVVAWISDKLGLAKDDKTEALIAERVQPLLDQILPARSISIDLQGTSTRLGPSDRDGISAEIHPIPGDPASFKDGQTITSPAANFSSTVPTAITTTFATATGWAIISDIDDTIKKTMTSSPLGILRTTFAESPEPIQGMPELYAHLRKALDAPPFWYLSASPYNLYPFLHAFRSTHYPPGQLILREASWMNLAGFLANLTQATAAYKQDRMRRIHAQFPNRRFLCIGDSTQKDPEAYGAMFREFPGWVGAVFIRRVKGVEGMEGSGKNDDARFDKAFEGVPRERWHVFDDPAELYARVEELAREGGEQRPRPQGR